MSVADQVDRKVTYWPRFLLNPYEETYKASYRVTVDLRLFYLSRQFRSYVSLSMRKAKRYTQQAKIGVPQKVGHLCFINTYLGTN